MSSKEKLKWKGVNDLSFWILEGVMGGEDSTGGSEEVTMGNYIQIGY